ncbi:hypothetical protein D3C76_1099870 [compost metagenome]
MSTSELLQRFVGRFRHPDDLRRRMPCTRRRVREIEPGPGVPAQQYKGRIKCGDDLADTGRRIGDVGNGEGQSGAQRAEHGIHQARTAARNNHHPPGSAGAAGDQPRSDTLTDLFKLAITAGNVLGNDGRGIRRAFCLVHKVVEYRALGTILQAQRRNWAQIRHVFVCSAWSVRG